MLWRNDSIGQAALRLPDSDTEIVLTTRLEYAPNWLVSSADEAADAFVRSGGRVVTPAFDIPVGRVVVVADASAPSWCWWTSPGAATRPTAGDR